VEVGYGEAFLTAIGMHCTVLDPRLLRGRSGAYGCGMAACTDLTP
jgi:hypothetical protein